MAEQIFLSPNFFEREIDLTQKTVPGPEGTPGGIIGQSQKGPAFVPVTIANFSDFESKFGSYNINMPSVYAAEMFLKDGRKKALTFTRVLGAGSNSDVSDFIKTKEFGIVKNAGFFISGSITEHVKAGFVTFISAKHTVNASEAEGYPIFTHNDSISDPTKDSATLLRGMVLLPTSSRMIVASNATSVSSALSSEPTQVNAENTFKLIISSSVGSSFGNDENLPGIKVYNVSLDPNSQNYISNVLNSDPTKFVDAQHLLYAHFPVESSIAMPLSSSLLQGSSQIISNINSKNITAKETYGRFDTRYNAPSSTFFISQPFGDKEFKLFKFESLDDGDFAAGRYKISINNLRASEDETNPYGTFSVLIRDWNDTDQDLRILEQFNGCNLNPSSPNYIGKVIGDYKVSFNHDSIDDSERGLKLLGKFANNSKYVRIILSDELESGLVPKNALPFGFLGLDLLKTSYTGTDAQQTISPFLAGLETSYNGSIMPPIPFTYKLTEGQIGAKSETLNLSHYWGVKFTKVVNPSYSNYSIEKNDYIPNIIKFLGIKNLGLITNDDESNNLCNNKFTLAKVLIDSYIDILQLNSVPSEVSMKNAKYIRNAKPVNGTINGCLTFASIISNKDPYIFNKYSKYMKFTNVMQGGFNGLNILDQNESRMDDKSTSFSGCAADGYKSPGLNSSPGKEDTNNAVASYMTAAKIMTDRNYVRHNLLIVPGIREEFITDYISSRVKNNYGLCLYIMDMPNYDSSNQLIFDYENKKPDVSYVISRHNARNLDNNFIASYFPDCYIDARVLQSDEEITRRIKVPSSIVALSAISYSDSTSYPWYAPAGFNRGGVNDIVKNTTVRLNTDDRNSLYDSRINPIAKISQNDGYVVFGQKTLQLKKSALDRINVRRLLLELRKIVIDTSRGLLFEQNTKELKSQFIKQMSDQLSAIKTFNGIESFKIIMDDTNNTEEDVRNNMLNGKILIVPTRAIEFIAIDFIITNSGVQFT